MLQMILPFLAKTVLPMVLSSMASGALGGNKASGGQKGAGAGGLIQPEQNKTPINLMGFPSLDKSNLNYGQAVSEMLKRQRGF